MTIAFVAVISALILAIVGLAIWLAKSRERAIQAEEGFKHLAQGQERTHEANKIIAESVSDEHSWLARTRKRLRDRSGQS
jgi:hypothetical protein